jgi:L-fuculose-phosphate aldolase
MAREIVLVAREMTSRGLTSGTSGNVSARIEGGMLITPSGIPYDEMGPDDLVSMGFDGPRSGVRRPSTEWRLHAGILDARPDVGAVVHAHPPHATALACLQRDIPAFHYMVAVAGGDSIRCAPYATFGTRALATHAVEALEGRTACLLANHGLVAAGATAGEALGLAFEVESLAQTYVLALNVGEPVLLGEEEMARVLGQFKGYGQH